MGLMTPGVLALAALGAGPDGPPQPAPMVATQVRVLEMKDLAWRSAAHAKLTPVARRDGATVWTAPADVLPSLMKDALNVVQAPKVTSVAGQPATIQTKQVRQFVANMGLVREARVAGPNPDGAVVFTGYAPDVDQVKDGIEFEVVARSLDQGTLAGIRLRSSRIGALHPVVVKDPRGQDAPHHTDAIYQVPEVIEEGVSGEWVIPKGGLLVIGMGPRTTTDKAGKTAVRERVVVVQAQPVEGPATTARLGAAVVGREVVYASPGFAAPVPASVVDPDLRIVEYVPGGTKRNGHVSVHPVYVLAALPWGALPGPMGMAAQAHILGVGGPVIRPGWPQDADATVRRTAAAAPAGRPMPRVPSRHLPGTITPDGTRAVLPPLPDHEPDPASYDPSGEPRPSPQTLAQKPVQDVTIRGKVVIRGADGVELIADGLTIRTLPKVKDEAVTPASATAIKANEPLTPPCCEADPARGKDKAAGWSKPKDRDAAARPTVAVGAAPLKLQLPNSRGAVELEIHAVPAP